MTCRDEPPDASEACSDTPAAAPTERRAAYQPPLLEVLGDVRDLTLGPSPGVGDSVNPATRQPPV